ncbi:MAG TPA: FAD-dependent oxidoreductase [Acidimicrobiia bacterium]
MSRRKRRVAVLGGGMAGMAAAWRLSEPGWRDEFETITVYQRGWRLGGKGASSRGANGRIEEHGLHLWLGYYENAFRMLRECYAELDRSSTDPTARVRTWRDAMIATPEVGLEDLDLGTWRHWMGRFSTNDELPGDPDAPDAGNQPMATVDYVRRALRLVADFLESLTTAVAVRSGRVVLSTSRSAPPGPDPLAASLPVAALAGVLEALQRLHHASDRDGHDDNNGHDDLTGAVTSLDRALTEVRAALRELAAEDPDVRRTWHLVSVMTASVRGVLADGLLTDPNGFRAVNDEDFLDWIIRHGAAPEVAEFAFIRGLYDLVFADRGAARTRHGVSAGVAVFMTSKMFFEYKGAIFWKMTAGMGDIVFAPMYEVLRKRGVDFEFFHRVDALHVADDGLTIEAITMGRQAALRSEQSYYEPLVRVGDLPTFPDAPLADQLTGADGIERALLEAHWCDWPDAEQIVLQRGVDFDDMVFAIPIGMAPYVARELITRRPEWRSMVEHVQTTATQALQLWLRPEERDLGWPYAGATVSAYAQPFNTWASMDQLREAECWPDAERPGTIAYFCGALGRPANGAPPPPANAANARRQHRTVEQHALRFMSGELTHLLPGLAGPFGTRWELLCGAGSEEGMRALATQYVRANVDPSDRYVLCAPGSDRFRLRADESGFDNLFLAGDWTDNGLNAGCIEAAVLGGLQAANAVLGHSRNYRIAGNYLG